MNKLIDYVMARAVRGACQCGRCFDAPESPEKHQPAGHTANLVFFNVANNGATKDAFLQLIKSECPKLLDGKEHSYLEIGALLGDQGAALMTMGLGSLVGAWNLLTPYTVLGSLCDAAMANQMAGMGMVSIQTPADELRERMEQRA